MNEAHIALRLDLLALCFVTFNQETAQKNIIKGRRGGVAVEKVVQSYITSRRTHDQPRRHLMGTNLVNPEIRKKSASGLAEH